MSLKFKILNNLVCLTMRGWCVRAFTPTLSHTNQVFGKDPFMSLSMMKLMAPHVTKL